MHRSTTVRSSSTVASRAALLACFGLAATFGAAAEPSFAKVYDVRAHGAKGDGVAVDSPAINAAIEAAAAAGGGTVWFPAGTYLSFSIRLKSHITLHLDAGATLLAADPAEGKGKYDEAEPNEWDAYQDFGHSHWQNSLIWGIGLENVTIEGRGRIDGKGLTRRGPGPRRPEKAGDTPTTLGSARAAERALAAEEGRTAPPPRDEWAAMAGLGNKAIALKLCRNVTLRDFTIYRGGHFAILPTGVDNFTIDNLRIDTQRDAINIDACRNVRISNSVINTPNDDGIVLKSSYGLGFARPTENVTITNCVLSAFDLGTMLDGTFGRTHVRAPDGDGPTGRIKFGTESNGGFRNITISNCTFSRCRGLALEMVDGGVLEDVTITNITMQDIVNSPLFIRLGNRGRGPGPPPVGKVRRVKISNVVVSGADSRFASIVSGIPGHPIEDVDLSDIRIVYNGMGTAADAAIDPPEKAESYPEPSMFGTIPAYGLFVRHVKGLTVRNVSMSFTGSEARPAIRLDNVTGADFSHVTAPTEKGVPTFVLKNVKDFTAFRSTGAPDVRHEAVEATSF